MSDELISVTFTEADLQLIYTALSKYTDLVNWRLPNMSNDMTAPVEIRSVGEKIMKAWNALDPDIDPYF